jgi:hypothetical protein
MSIERHLPPATRSCATIAIIACAFAVAETASAQVVPPPRPGTDSVVVQPSKKYGASGVHRFLLGDNYRDLWAKPAKVPVLNLATYAGGLKGVEEGGNAQTRNLRLLGADEKFYVFRPIFKEVLQIDSSLKNTLLEDIFADGLSASHPAATVMPSPLLSAAGVIHATPVLYVMPDDERLGEFRHFAGKLGTLEEFPADPDDGKNGWFGAVDVIDSEDILEKINEDGSNRIDAHALLTARLVDLLIGDNDRHPGQFKWIRRSNDDRELWVPMPRDRDKAFVSYEGFLLKAARLALPRLVTYRNIPQTASFYNAVDFDRRLLVSLERSDFDSTARFLQRVITDAVIDSAVKLMPKEWHTVEPSLVSRMKSRRNILHQSADGYYRGLFTIVDLHGSDAGDRATIVRQADGSIDLKLSTKGVTFLDRKFSPDDTREIRLYLHDGADTAVVTGNAPRSIPLWIVGGAGANALSDSSVVGGKARPTRMYDNGGTSTVAPNVIVAAGDVKLPEADSAKGDNEKANGKEEKPKGVYDADTAWNRRPMVKMQGYELPPFRDRGASLRPTLTLSTGRGLGLMPTIAITRRKYGFRQFHYASRAELEVGYSTGLQAWEVELETDNRFESSRMFITTETGLTQLMTGRFGGFGNDLTQPEDRTPLDVKQKQVYFQPALGWALTPVTEFTMGPVVKFTTTDSTPNREISELRPYGFRRFGQAGFVARLLHESDRKVVKHGGTADELLAEDPIHVFTFDASAAVYPAVWDARTTFGIISAVATSKITLPLPLSPVIATRIGGQQNFGEFPYFEAAFLGGRQSVRTLHREAYAGDAMLYGTAELRVPIASFPFILPLNTGVFGFADVGRVYMDGESPGGWHQGTGYGVWLGVLRPSTSLTLTFTNQRDRRILVGTGFVF